MFIAPTLSYPGSILVGLLPERTHQVSVILSLLEGSLGEAAIALSQFNYTGQVQEQVHRARQEAFRRARTADDPGPAMHEAQHVRAEYPGLEGMPRSLGDRMPFIAAKLFTLSLDMGLKLARQLRDKKLLPPAGEATVSQFEASFPALKKVRNSMSHLEQRALGERNHGEKIDLKPINNGFISADCAIILSNLNGDKYGYTDERGEYSELEISHQSLLEFQKAIQGIISVYQWKGFSRTFPTT